jgi:hypothetical protein
VKSQSLAIILLLLCVSGCHSNPAQVSRVTSAIEVPLQSPADDADLIGILRRFAAANGMHVDDVSQKWRDFQRDANPPAQTRMSIYVGMWRGSEDHDLEASIEDMGHLRRAWLAFYDDGGKEGLPASARSTILAQIKKRWPDATSLPVLPSGGLPLASDLRHTEDGYKIAPDAAQRYNIPPTSPLLAR